MYTPPEKSSTRQRDADVIAAAAAAAAEARTASPGVAATGRQSMYTSRPVDDTDRDSTNKREAACVAMADREMVRQIGLNPFLTTNYVEGITIRDKFLMPYHESKPGTNQEEG